MDVSNLMEYGVVGVLVYVIGVLTWFLTKVLGAKYPILDGGGHAKRSADAAEEQLQSTQETNVMLKDMQSSQHRVEDAQLGQYARREDGTLKWMNNPDREKEIHETAETTKAIHRIITSMNE